MKSFLSNNPLSDFIKRIIEDQKKDFDADFEQTFLKNERRTYDEYYKEEIEKRKNNKS